MKEEYATRPAEVLAQIRFSFNVDDDRVHQLVYMKSVILLQTLMRNMKWFVSRSSGLSLCIKMAPKSPLFIEKLKSTTGY
jgi:DNA polymerase III psi subunit